MYWQFVKPRPSAQAVLVLAALSWFCALAGCASSPLNTLYSVARQDNRAEAPFAIAPRLYYVGSSDIAVFVLETPEGLILIDGGYESTASQVIANLRELGFVPGEVKYILNTHAHMDHAAGLAALRQQTGARLVASARGAEQIETGGRDDPLLGSWFHYPPATVDLLIGDGDEISLGGLIVTAHLTPGHTPGCTSWSFPVEIDGQKLQALVNCSLSTLFYDLRDNRTYPDVASDFEETFVKLKALPCDVPLGAHAHFFKLHEKRSRLLAGGQPSPFIDPEACQDFITEGEAAFRKKLARQGG